MLTHAAGKAAEWLRKQDESKRLEEALESEAAGLRAGRRKSACDTGNAIH
jgi:hypothetical protein